VNILRRLLQPFAFSPLSLLTVGRFPSLSKPRQGTLAAGLTSSLRVISGYSPGRPLVLKEKSQADPFRGFRNFSDKARKLSGFQKRESTALQSTEASGRNPRSTAAATAATPPATQILSRSKGNKNNFLHPAPSGFYTTKSPDETDKSIRQLIWAADPSRAELVIPPA